MYPNTVNITCTEIIYLCWIPFNIPDDFEEKYIYLDLFICFENDKRTFKYLKTLALEAVTLFEFDICLFSGGIMSIFLLGVYDPSSSKWCTVTKCHSGLDDKTLEELQTSLDMVKISKNADKVRVKSLA